jgi:hypothetical protein
LFIGLCLFDEANGIKNNNKEIMSLIFRNKENTEKGESLLLATWNVQDEEK